MAHHEEPTTVLFDTWIIIWIDGRGYCATVQTYTYYIYYSKYLAKLIRLKLVLLVAEVTVRKLNSSADGVVANAVYAIGNVRKAGGAIRLRS